MLVVNTVRAVLAIALWIAWFGLSWEFIGWHIDFFSNFVWAWLAFWLGIMSIGFTPIIWVISWILYGFGSVLEVLGILLVGTVCSVFAYHLWPKPNHSDLSNPLGYESETILSWCFLPYEKYAVFKGRSRRKEFWMFHLFYSIAISFLLFMVSNVDPPFYARICYVLYLIILSGSMLPWLALLVRRLHDTNHSGWWVLFGYIPLLVRFLGDVESQLNLGESYIYDERYVLAGTLGLVIVYIFCALDSHSGENKYGPNPKTANTGSPEATGDLWEEP